MRRLWVEINEHRRAVSWFVAAWGVLWAITIATWIYDEQGNSCGMPFLPFVLHLVALPLAAGLLTAGWHLRSPIAGLLVAEADLLLIALWGGVLSLLGRVAPDPQMAGILGFLEFLGFVVLMGGAGALSGWVGGAAGRWIAARRT